MKLRADLAAMIVAGLTVIAITVLAVEARAIPEVLTTIALVVVGGGVGIAAPALGQPGSASDGTADAVATLAGKLEELLAHAETSTGAAQAAARAAVRAAQSVTDTPAVPAQPTSAGYAPPSSANGYSTAGTAAGGAA